tara:strand:- start:352 stop:513 length:162 start_codon:yes stop_codon:yes gene_type:complete
MSERKQTLEMDIEYLRANIDNGWYISLNQDKNDVLSHLEYKQNELNNLIIKKQ